MTYSAPVIPARFIARPNRFIALVDVDGKPETVHVKNTGRCRELLLPNATVYLAAAQNPTRKTTYDLVAVDKAMTDGSVTVNIDSQMANEAAHEWLCTGTLFPKDATVRREVTHGASRFDLCIENADGRGATAYLEVKGCTLERDGIALFPDAPTERGVKHIRELISLAAQGIPAYMLFVIQMKGTRALRPNDETHPAFGDALREAEKAGVQVLAVDCTVTPDTVTVDGYVPVEL